MTNTYQLNSVHVDTYGAVWITISLAYKKAKMSDIIQYAQRVRQQSVFTVNTLDRVPQAVGTAKVQRLRGSALKIDRRTEAAVGRRSARLEE